MNEFTALYETILERRENPQEGSYTCYLFAQGLDKILKKMGEESAEAIVAAKNNDKDGLIYELADLAFHAAVLMAQQGIVPGDVAEELGRRAQKAGNLKQFHQTDKNT